MISTTGRSPSIAAPMPGADESLLGDRRVAHPIGTELGEQAGRNLVGAFEDTDLLAHHEDALIALKLLAQREAQRLAVGHRLGPGDRRGGLLDRRVCGRCSFAEPSSEDELPLAERRAR